MKNIIKLLLSPLRFLLWLFRMREKSYPKDMQDKRREWFKNEINKKNKDK